MESIKASKLAYEGGRLTMYLEGATYGLDGRTVIGSYITRGGELQLQMHDRKTRHIINVIAEASAATKEAWLELPLVDELRVVGSGEGDEARVKCKFPNSLRESVYSVVRALSEGAAVVGEGAVVNENASEEPVSVTESLMQRRAGFSRGGRLRSEGAAKVDDVDDATARRIQAARAGFLE